MILSMGSPKRVNEEVLGREPVRRQLVISDNTAVDRARAPMARAAGTKALEDASR